MCGLVGVFGNLSLATNKYLANAFTTGTVRGHHSTGAFWCNRDDEVWLTKDAVHGQEFIESKVVAAELKVLTNLFFIGHNRWATRGAINADNAHPFSHSGVTLVHNGTLDEDIPNMPTFGTDSEQIAYALSKVSPSAATDVLESLEGAFALIWADTRNSTLNFARNDERELYLGFTSTNSVLVASEKLMLEWLADRNKVTLEAVELLPVGEVISFNTTDMRKMTGRLAPTRRTKFTPKERTYSRWSSGYYAGVGGGSTIHNNRKEGYIVDALVTQGNHNKDIYYVEFDSIDQENYSLTYNSRLFVGSKEEAQYLADNAVFINGVPSRSSLASGRSYMTQCTVTTQEDVILYRNGSFIKKNMIVYDAEIVDDEEPVQSNILLLPNKPIHVLDDGRAHDSIISVPTTYHIFGKPGRSSISLGKFLEGIAENCFSCSMPFEEDDEEISLNLSNELVCGECAVSLRLINSRQGNVQ